MSPRTKQNLLNAMKSEASESATFSRFAAHARMDNDSDLAETLQDSADGDRIKDFAREAALTGLVSENAENLRSAIASAMEDCRMYTQFELEATNDGDLDVATAFQEICQEKTSRCERLESLMVGTASHSQAETLEG